VLLFERDGVINAYKNTLAADVEVSDCQFRHRLGFPNRARRIANEAAESRNSGTRGEFEDFEDIMLAAVSIMV